MALSIKIAPYKLNQSTILGICILFLNCVAGFANAQNEKSQSPSNELPQQESTTTDVNYYVWLALDSHPALQRSLAEIQSTHSQAYQAGLLPNPSLGIFADEVGNDDDPGLWGIYLQRKIIRSNRLQLGRSVKQHQASIQEVELESLALKIETDVRTAYVSILLANQKVELASQIATSLTKATEQVQFLVSQGESPKTDLYQMNLQMQTAKLRVREAQVELRNAWRKLAAVCNQSSLDRHPTSGKLDQAVEEIEFEDCLARIVQMSPEVSAAELSVERACIEVQRQTALGIPDYQSQIRAGKDSTTEHFFVGAQLQMPLMRFDRNQGNIAASRYQLQAARENLKDIKLSIRNRLADRFRRYELAKVQTESYQQNLIPQAQNNLDLLTKGYPEEVGFLQILGAQQAVVELTFQYLDSLRELWVNRIQMDGFLLAEVYDE
ncbi:MAG: TolC family protein [Planctomycetota bacterium]